MVQVAVTSFYAALLSGLFIALSARVIGKRRSGRIPLGVTGRPELERAVRVQANFAEYVPLTLIALLLVELRGSSAWLVHLLGLTLLAGRAIHAFGVSRSPEDFRFRVSGMALTLGALGASAALLFLASLFGVVL